MLLIWRYPDPFWSFEGVGTDDQSGNAITIHFRENRYLRGDAISFILASRSTSRRPRHRRDHQKGDAIRAAEAARMNHRKHLMMDSG